MTDKHYVYAYYDPRNFEIFYIGKGQGKRKFAHLSQEDKSEKTKRIKKIQNEELEPIIRVLVKDLKESEAYLFEKTLIWSNYNPNLTIPKNDFSSSVFIFNINA